MARKRKKKKRKKKPQDDGENEEQLKNFARGCRLLLEVQSNSAEVELPEEDEGAKKGAGGNQQHFKFHTTASLKGLILKLFFQINISNPTLQWNSVSEFIIEIKKETLNPPPAIDGQNVEYLATTNTRWERDIEVGARAAGSGRGRRQLCGTGGVRGQSHPLSRCRCSSSSSDGRGGEKTRKLSRFHLPDATG